MGAKKSLDGLGEPSLDIHILKEPPSPTATGQLSVNLPLHWRTVAQHIGRPLIEIPFPSLYGLRLSGVSKGMK